MTIKFQPIILPAIVEGLCALCGKERELFRVIGTTGEDSIFCYCEECIQSDILKHFLLDNCSRCASLAVNLYSYPEDSIASKQQHLCAICKKNLDFQDWLYIYNKKERQFKKDMRIIENYLKEVKENVTK